MQNEDVKQQLKIKENSSGETGSGTLPSMVAKTVNLASDLQEQLTQVQEHVTDLTTVAWTNFFAKLSVGNPFIKTVISSPQGFGVVLKDGTFLPVRAVHDETDADSIKTFLENLSPESRYLRFHQPMPVIKENVAKHLANRDGHERVALIALVPSVTENDTTTIVAMAEYVICDIPEVAIAVADEWQGKGVGTEMLKLLATLSIAAGYRTWNAEVLNSNKSVQKLLTKVGKVKRISSGQGSSELHIELQTKKIFAQ